MLKLVAYDAIPELLLQADTEKVAIMQVMLADIFRPYCGHFVGQNNSSVINQVKQTIHNIVDILIQYIRLDDRMTSMLQ